MTDQELRDRQIEVLGHKGVGFTEFRNLGSGKFVGINPRRTPTGTTNHDVIKITCIVIDIDPINGGLNAVELAKNIILGENFKSYVLISSGRGVHLYVPVDLPTNTDIKGYFEYLRETYKREGYIIDKIHDLARVIRVWGSINEKNGKRCEILEDHFQGINTFKLPVFKSKSENQTQSENSIINGNRNNTLTSLAGTMRRKGMSKEAIISALLAENTQRCVPPLPEAEVLTIAESVARYDPTQMLVTKTISSNYFLKLKQRTPGYSTGFSRLDRKLAGLQPGKLYTLAAFTGFGKTTFSCQLVSNLIHKNIRVLYFPTEIGQDVLIDKIIAQTTGIELEKFQLGDFTESELNIISNQTNVLEKLPFLVYEDFSLTVSKLEEQIRINQPQVIVVDFIHAMFFPEGGTPLELKMAAQQIQGIAIKYKVAIILCAQLNRSTLLGELSLSQIKGCNAIAECSDVVMFLVPLKVHGDYPLNSDLHIMKHRYGDPGKIRFTVYTKIGKFEENELF